MKEEAREGRRGKKEEFGGGWGGVGGERRRETLGEEWSEIEIESVRKKARAKDNASER